MTLEQLRIFVAVAERQHLTQAARALGIAQSAASAAIAALEARHGVALFHRVGRGITLTEAGEILLPEARAVLARVAGAELALADLAGLARGRLMLMASQTIASYWLPRHLVAFHRLHPQIRIHLRIGNTAQVAAAVEDGSADLGFVEALVTAPNLERLPLATDRLVLLVGPDHPWAHRTAITPAALTETDWVLREPGSGTRAVLEAGLARLGVEASRLSVALELPSNEAVRAAVEAGLGATALSASVAAPSLEAGLLHLVALDLPERGFDLLRHRQHRQSRAAEALVALIRHR